MKNFVLFGSAGYIAPRHMKAIKETGNNLVASFDPHDGVGIIDNYFPNSKYFKEFEIFDRFVEKFIQEGNKIDYVSICSPNYLHDAHVRYGLRIGADIICEKPLVLNPWNVGALETIERKSKKKINCILQLRHHPDIISLKNKIKNDNLNYHEVSLNYITSRGSWYLNSWKGDISKSGGLSTNIGIHFFDMLIWIFGDVDNVIIKNKTEKTVKGILELKNAKVDWNLSIDSDLIPSKYKKLGQRTFRSIKVDDKEIEFSSGFVDLHTISYKNIINGKGFGTNDAKKSIDLVSRIRNL